MYHLCIEYNDENEGGVANSSDPRLAVTGCIKDRICVPLKMYQQNAAERRCWIGLNSRCMNYDKVKVHRRAPERQ